MLSICNGALWILQLVKTKTEACKEKLVDFNALDEVPCLPQMEHETFLTPNTPLIQLWCPWSKLNMDYFSFLKKGQIISKGFFLSSISSKKRTKTSRFEVS